ncbi:MAG: DUF1127 domain-containing protein [Pseudomonadota bacterium]
MALIDNAHKAPFGAITVYRFVSGVEALTADFTAWQRQRKSLTKLAAMTPAELDDMGLTVADAQVLNEQGPSLFAWLGNKLAERRDAARTARALATLSPRMLEDVGMTEADVEGYRRQAGF